LENDEKTRIGSRLRIGNVFATGACMSMVESLPPSERGMTLGVFLQLLRCHQAALQSSVWSFDATRPALYLNETETQAVITELTALLADVAVLRASSVKSDVRRATFAPCVAADDGR
jgi:hypothetical protein